MANDQAQPLSQARKLIAGSQIALLHFYHPPADGSRPAFTITDESGAGIKIYGHDVHEMLIEDIRGRLAQFSLETHSFAAVTNLPRLDIASGDEVTPELLKQASEIIRSFISNLRTVTIFDVAIRRADPKERLRKPVKKVHIDQSGHGAWQRAARHFSKPDLQLLRMQKIRFRIVNIWMPLDTAVNDNPLSFR